MKTQKLIAFLFIASLFMTLSCKKTETGPQGEKGDPGTANVMYSDWFQFSLSYADNNHSFYSMELSVPQIDQDFINKGGTVLMYMGYAEDGKTDSVGQIKSLPTWGKEGYLNESSASAVYYELNYTYDKNGIIISFIVTQGLDRITSGVNFFPEVFNGTNYYFRYVLIPGGVNVNNRTSAPIDYNDYKAVKAFYSIPG